MDIPQLSLRHRQQVPVHLRLRHLRCKCPFDMPRNSGAKPQSQSPSGHEALPQDHGIRDPGPLAPPPPSSDTSHCSPGHTPLHVAVIHKDAEMVRLLRKAGADLNKPVSCPRETVWQGGVIPRVGRVSSDRSAAPSRSPRAAGAPCTWQWRPKRPTCWSFF